MDRRSIRSLYLFAGLLLLTSAVYWPVHRFGFVDFDDDNYVFKNPQVHGGFSLAVVKEAFSSFRLGNYHPLVWLSYHADWVMFHLQPGPMHVENVLFHLVTAVLLWRWFDLASGKFYRSFAVAALFLCHPMHVESVAWISERKDVLSTAWLLGAMLAYLGYCHAPMGRVRWIAYSMMLIAFAFSLLSKAMGVTFPALLLLIDFWPLKRWPGRSWIALTVEKLPPFLMSATAIAIGTRAQMSNGALTPLVGLSLLDRFDNAVVCYIIYIAKLAVPTNLSILYVHPGSRPLPIAILAMAMLALVTIAFYRFRSSRPYLIVGWLWFLGTLVPVIGVMQNGSQAMADRYSYFPSIGLFLAGVWFVADWISSLHRSQQYRFALQSMLLVSVLWCFTTVAHSQVLYWKDSESLFTHAVQVSDDSPVSHVILGQAALDKQDYQRAMSEFQRSEEIAPNPKGFNGLGDAWVTINPAGAVGYYQKALSMVPKSTLYHVKLAKAFRLDGQWDAARDQTLQALAIDPNYAPARQELDAISAPSPR